MSEVLSKFLQKFEHKKYYDFCLLSAYLLAWLVVAYIGISELISLFSNNRLGLLEALLFTQIDLLLFQRSGIEIVSNGSWRSVNSDTLLNDFRYWYNIIWIGLWLLSLRVLTSDHINTLVKNINLVKISQSGKSIALGSKAIFKTSVYNFSSYLRTKRENLEKLEGINASPNYQSKENDKGKLYEESDVPEFKECPYCCEQILYRAIKCKHCGSKLEPVPATKGIYKATSNTKLHNNDITWKHYVGIFFIVTVLFSMFSEGEQSYKPDKESAKSLCRSYIAKIMGRHISIVRTKHIKYDGGHFVKAYYNRTSDGDYFEFVCSLDNNNIVWAGVFNGNELGRWRYEDEMKYKRNKDGSWKLY